MKALVLSSGGIDSTTVLGMAVNKYGKENVISLSISYGQKHNKELIAANEVAKYYGVEQLFLDLAKIFEYSNCSLLQQSTEEIPEETGRGRKSTDSCKDGTAGGCGSGDG